MLTSKIPYKIYLEDRELPTEWLNIKAFMPERPAPMLNPQTLQPVTREELAHVFCEESVNQELNETDKYIPIPQPVRDFYFMYRPSPLVRAYHLERYLDTPAEIYYKFEGTNTSGSHKLNSAVVQAYAAKQQGLTSLTTETGAGQWGTALAMACGYFGLKLKVFMVKVSSEQKPYRKAVMETYGAEVIPSPSETTEVGRQILREHPDTGGSLGCAVSEAAEAASQIPNCRYALGSVMDHVILHQSIIGLECQKAMRKYGISPDIVIGCVGGGSNFGGLIAPFVAEKLQGFSDVRLLAVEPSSCPTLTRGVYAYDFGDTGRLTPLMKMYTLGSSFIPSPSHAGGLRYHGMNPIVSKLYNQGYVEAVSYPQTKVFESAKLFARLEGYLPAPESSHAIRAAIDEALKCKANGEKKRILLGLTGTGYFDLAAYQAYNNGTMQDGELDETELQKGLSHLPAAD